MTDKIRTPQDFFDDNRILYGAESSSFDLEKFNEKCGHYFERKSFSRVECKRCHMGYTENNRMIIEAGKIVSIK
jgi:hypothetical protein